MKQSMVVFNNMKRNGMFDAVTVNTLVSVAVNTGCFHVAESILGNYTESSHVYTGNNALNQHPNVEAYTELIDGYGKAGRLSKAVQLLQTMRTRGVNPNEITYTSVIGALSRSRRIKQAKDTLQFMENVDRIKPGVITYNAMICGLVDSSTASLSNDDDHRDFPSRIEIAMEVYHQMISNRVRPNSITISTLIDGLTRCQPSKFLEAKQLLSSSVRSNLIRSNDFRVGTSMIRAFASVGDVDGFLATYRNMEKRDVVSLNILLDSLCRCGKIHKALLIFSQLSSKKPSSDQIRPDVITYSILIGELLRIGTERAVSNVRNLYKDMKSNRGLMPDCALVDV
jgi:pentatricopeptide repeat protein